MKTETLSSRQTISVWLVEDNEMFRRTLARVLSQLPDVECGHQFSNAEDAIETLEQGSVPDLVLLDVELPGLNGIAAIRRIKSISPATRVVMLTVFDDHNKVLQAVCAGASGYLLKTSSVEKIVESIHEALAGGAALNPRVAKSVLEMFAALVGEQHDYGLTDRESMVLKLMTQGFIKKEIADKMSVSYHTVDTHLRNIYTKLHVHSRTGAVAKALKERLF